MADRQYRLLRKQSSLAIVIQQAKSKGQGEDDDKNNGDDKQEPQRNQNISAPPSHTAQRDKDEDSEGGDTDVVDSSDDEAPTHSQPPLVSFEPTKSKSRARKSLATDEQPEPPFRMSRRLMSMKRRGKVRPLVELTEEFEFYAGDILTVRGEEEDFYVCRILQDVPESAASFSVAWYNRVADNTYESSFDDVCYMESVITRIKLEIIPDQEGMFTIPRQHLKKTVRLLREALAAERGEELEVEGIEEEEDDEEEEEDEDEEDQPPAKRTRRSSRSASVTPPTKTRKGKKGATPRKTPQKKRAAKPGQTKQAKAKQAAVKKDKPRRPGTLIPILSIEPLDKNPTFETSEDASLMPCRWAIRAVMLNDMDMLKEAIQNTQEVYSVHWHRSADIPLTALHYALLRGNKEAVTLLVDDFLHPKKDRCKQPQSSLSHMDTGSYNFHTFGHAVRELYASRGSREGNNAFHESDHSFGMDGYFEFCLRREVPLEMVQFLLSEFLKHSGPENKHSLPTETEGIHNVWRAIRAGNRQLAGYFVSKGVEKFGFGFNFLHKEVLLNDSEPLSKFRSPSVKKKPTENKTILPIHAACINPNGQYLSELLSSLPEYAVADAEGFKPVHYAAACDGPGPLKVLLERGVDPNDPGPKKKSPLMIAAERGRDENIKVLLNLDSMSEEAMDEESVRDPGTQRVTLNAKDKYTMAAIHFAAKHGHSSTVRLLVENGANVDLQTASSLWNVTALMFAARQGHLNLVKTLVDLGANPGKRGKWNKTALTYAIKNGHAAIVAFLLRTGLDPNEADTSGNSAAHYAAGFGWLYCLKMLIKAGANPNAANQWKVTPLALALLKDHMPCAEYLLSLDTVDVNFPDEHGRTLLSQTILNSAVDQTLLDRLTFLVEKKGADVTKTDTDNWSPLHHLAGRSVYQRQDYDQTLRHRPPPKLEKSRAELACKVAKLLISSGADPNGLNKKGQTPVMVAILQNNFPLVSMLLESGAKASAGKDKLDEQALHYQAKQNDDLDLKEIFPNETEVLSGTLDEQKKQREKFLKSLVRQASNKMLGELISGGANIDCQRYDGMTPLLQALSQSNMDSFWMLLLHGADPAAGKLATEKNILHLLAEKCGQDLKKYMDNILEKAAERLQEMCNVVDSDGFTPLLQACATYSSCSSSQEQEGFAREFIKALIERCGANVEATVAKKKPVKANAVVVDEDSESQGDEQEEDEDVEYDEYEDEDEEEVDEEEGGAEDDEEEKEEDDEEEKEEDDDEEQQQEDMEVDNEAGDRNVAAEKEIDRAAAELYGPKGLYSCLHFLANKLVKKWPGKPESDTCLELILGHLQSSSAILNGFNLDGLAPLHLAVMCNNNDAVTRLLAHGANPNLMSKRKVRNRDATEEVLAPALVFAARPTAHYGIVVSLLGAKVDPNLPDSNERTALSWAMESGSNSTLSVAKALLEAGADVNRADKDRRSPLHYAVNATTGGFEVLTEVEGLLVNYGADTSAVDIRGRTPLHYSFVKRKRHTDYSLSDPISIVDLLCQGMEEQGRDIRALVNHQDLFGQTPLHRASLRGATICALTLLQKGADIDVKDKDGNTPFSLALRGQHNGCAMMCMQKNAKASCEVITPVTPGAIEGYERKKKANLWKWKEAVSLKKPTSVVKPAFRCVVEYNWQGLAYLMLEVAGLNFIEAIQATLEAGKGQLALTLLKKQRNDASVRGVNKHGRSLLHMVAIHISNGLDLACHLLERGVSPGTTDKLGATPLHYAACNNNKALCKLLLDRAPSCLDVADLDGVTPFAAVFSGCGGFLQASHIELIEMLVDARPKTLDICYIIEDGRDRTTPLIEAATDRKEKLVAFLLSKGASVNFATPNGRTALTEVVVNNLLDMAQVLIYGTHDRVQWTRGRNTKVDFNATDVAGKTVVHRCVKNRDYVSSESVDMLKLLAKSGAPLDVRDPRGHTPLFYAKQQASGVMKKALVELLGEENAAQDTEEPDESDYGFTFTTSRDQYWTGPEPDVDGDAEAMLEEAKKQDKPVEKPDTVQIDSNFQMEGAGEVYVDPDTGVPYDIVMSKVDVKYGYYGLNNFYKMQIIHRKGKDLWVLFNRWGRVGDSGQHQRTPYNTPEEATKEFKKIFKSKAGNEWENKDNFQKQPKKYALVLPERNPELIRKPVGEVLKPFDLEKCPKSRLPEEVQVAMKAMIDVKSLRDAMDARGVRIDQQYMPFGRLSMATILKAREILMEIKAIVDTIDTYNLKGTEEKFEKIADLSNAYYMMVPVARYTFERITPLNQKSDIEQHLNALNNLTELAAVSKILLGAQYRSKEVNPLDYCYRALGCHVELMEPTSHECQLLLEYLHVASGSSVQVDSILRIARPGEKECMADCGVDNNHRLLWHGTKNSNMIGILQQGLRIAPPEAPTTGWSLGKGIYTSDSVEKSLAYTSRYDNNGGFLLLCEVALGKVHDTADHSYFESPPEGCNSVWLVSRKVPNPAENVTTPYGCLVPTGKPVDTPNPEEKYGRSIYNYHNEYVVYDTSQVQLRYMVHFKRSR